MVGVGFVTVMRFPPIVNHDAGREKQKKRRSWQEMAMRESRVSHHGRPGTEKTLDVIFT